MLLLILIIIATLVFSPWLLWVLYLLVMWIQRKHLDDKYAWYEYLWVLPIVLVAYAVDIGVNYFVASVWFWELPVSWRQEKTVTERLNRYYFGPDNWKRDVAVLIGHLLLDRWDRKGKHIGYIKPE